MKILREIIFVETTSSLAWKRKKTAQNENSLVSQKSSWQEMGLENCLAENMCYLS